MPSFASHEAHGEKKRVGLGSAEQPVLSRPTLSQALLGQ